MACSSDDDEGKAPDSLAGTTWRHDYDYEDGDYEELQFTASMVKLVSSMYETFTLTYQYDAPDITIYINEWNTLEGTVKGNKMSLTYYGDTSVGEECPFIFIKK
jgi:hypothetical protein